eukprot:TRINITY_DN1111_c0_g1_i2.p1 TRINITY_DN1111_c0_g1~~TRINITY_DN1111_c0_g1_i2.p1  ORF type:complete len:121 (-),score=5.68 TRINITY_DN1111_c0_g1_i2:191-553(-)
MRRQIVGACEMWKWLRSKMMMSKNWWNGGRVRRREYNGLFLKPLRWVSFHHDLSIRVRHLMTRIREPRLFVPVLLLHVVVCLLFHLASTEVLKILLVSQEEVVRFDSSCTVLPNDEELVP